MITFMTKRTKIGIFVAVVVILLAIAAFWYWWNLPIKVEWGGQEPDSFLFYKKKGEEKYNISSIENRAGVLFSENKRNQGEYYVLPRSGKISANGAKIDSVETIKLSLAYFNKQGQEPFSTDEIETLNKYLAKLYTGLQIEIDASRKIDNWKALETNNADSVFLDLSSQQAIDSRYTYHIVAVDDAVINKELNNFQGIRLASIVNEVEHNMILGGRNLFRNPMLFIHEFAHCFDLSDRNAAYDDTIDSLYVFDIMSDREMLHCTYTLNLVDLFAIHGIDESASLKDLNFVYSRIVDDSRYCYPIDDPCPCLNSPDEIDLDCCKSSIIEKLIKKAKDDPASNQGGYVMVINSLDEMYGIDIANLEKNYEQEWSFFINDPALIPKEEFVKNRIQTFREIRRMNMITLIKEEVESQGKVFNNQAYIDPMILNEEIGQYIPILESYPKQGDPIDINPNDGDGGPKDGNVGVDPIRTPNGQSDPKPIRGGLTPTKNGPNNSPIKLEPAKDKIPKLPQKGLPNNGDDKTPTLYSGKVLDKKTGKPISSAIVELSSPDLKERIRTKTNLEGEFVLQQKEKLDKAYLLISKGGYQISESYWEGSKVFYLEKE